MAEYSSYRARVITMREFSTRIVKIADISSGRGELLRAGELIRSGGLVAFPTETVYGLGANGLDAAASAKIYEAKCRPSDNPLILHVASREMMDRAARVTPLAEKILSAFAPGPVTVILPKKSSVPDSVTGGLPTVGVRMPKNDIALALIEAARVPIAAPSANISGRPSPTNARAVLENLSGRIPLILDGGACECGVESTIIDCTGEAAVILRPGVVTPRMLREAGCTVRLDPALTSSAPEDLTPKAPGMKYTHYAPLAPMTLITGERGMVQAEFCRIASDEKSRVGRVGFVVSREISKELAGLVPERSIAVYGAREDLAEIAANLYESLRYFDGVRVDEIFAEGVPERGIGLAIMNRLRKASGGHVIFLQE